MLRRKVNSLAQLPEPPHIPAMSSARRYRIECECGHVGYVPAGPFIPRAQLLARCRCSWCGKRGAKDMIVEVIDTTPGWIKD